MSNSQVEIELNTSEEKIRLDIGKFYIEFPFTKSMVFVMAIFCLHLYDQEGKRVMTLQKIATGLGYKDRQWANHILKKIQGVAYDCKLFFLGHEQQQVIKKDVLAQVTALVCQYPLKKISELLMIYHDLYGYAMPRHEFRKYVACIDVGQLLPHLRKQLAENQLNLDLSYYLKLVLNQSCSNVQKAYIKQHSIGKEAKIIPISQSTDDLTPTLSYLYAAGCSLGDLSLLFNIPKSTISYRIHQFAQDLDFFLPAAVEKYSGKIAVDDKWVKVNGTWHYVLTAVDAISGVPLLSKRMPSLTIFSWASFFFMFEQLYGIPQMVSSDGDPKIGAAMQFRWNKVNHQLCWFHKLRNLKKKINQHIKDKLLHKRALRLFKGAFHNASNRTRKNALKVLGSFKPEIDQYITNSFFKPWKKLSLCLTNNVVERYNRKLQKAFQPRYGIKNEACADVLVNLVWWKDYIHHQKKQHNSIDPQIDLAKVFRFDFQQATYNTLHNSKFMHFNVKELCQKPLFKVS